MGEKKAVFSREKSDDEKISIHASGECWLEEDCPFCSNKLILSFNQETLPAYCYFRVYCQKHSTIRYGKTLEDIIKPYDFLVKRNDK